MGGHAGKVVVVAEDEALVRLMAVDALTDAGFEVVDAGHAEHALEILHFHPTAICVLFTDIHMPGTMDGLALAHYARTHWPWIGLLIASGQARPGLAELPAGSRFLPKPYDLDHVVAHIQELAGAE